MAGKWYTKTHKHTECENEDVTVLWNLQVHTERKVQQIGQLQ